MEYGYGAKYFVPPPAHQHKCSFNLEGTVQHIEKFLECGGGVQERDSFTKVPSTCCKTIAPACWRLSSINSGGVLSIAVFFGFRGKKRVQVPTIINCWPVMTNDARPLTIETSQMYILDLGSTLPLSCLALEQSSCPSFQSTQNLHQPDCLVTEM